MEYITLIFIFFALLFDRLNIFLFLFISAVIHEAGHISACCLYRVRPEIRLSVFGIKLCRYPETRLSKSVVLICGPLFNLIAATILWHLLQNKFTLDKYIFMSTNIVLFIFNMLPVYFLDGGQIVMLVCDNKLVRNIMDASGFIIIFIIAVTFSENIILSVLSLTLFLLYYLINKKDLHIF